MSVVARKAPVAENVIVGPVDVAFELFKRIPGILHVLSFRVHPDPRLVPASVGDTRVRADLRVRHRDIQRSDATNRVLSGSLGPYFTLLLGSIANGPKVKDCR